MEKSALLCTYKKADCAPRIILYYIIAQYKTKSTPSKMTWPAYLLPNNKTSDLRFASVIGKIVSFFLEWSVCPYDYETLSLCNTLPRCPFSYKDGMSRLENDEHIAR